MGKVAPASLGYPSASVSSDTKDLIEEGARRFLEEVPALKQLKLVMRLDLRARRDSQTWRVEFPDIDVKQGPGRRREGDRRSRRARTSTSWPRTGGCSTGATPTRTATSGSPARTTS